MVSESVSQGGCDRREIEKKSKHTNRETGRWIKTENMSGQIHLWMKRPPKRQKDIGTVCVQTQRLMDGQTD